MATAIVLIWNVYPNHKAFKKIPQWAMQLAGIVVFIFLSVVYKSGTAENPTWLEPHWWGILGIIGWAYLLCATVYLLVGKKIIWIALVLVVFQFLNAMQFIDFFGYKLSINFMVSASNHASITSGIVATLLYLEYGKTIQEN